MASFRSGVATKMVVCAAMAILTITSTLVGGLSECSDTLVYPYQAQCGVSPARYYGQEVYQFGDNIDLQQSLAPEWDETNSTYYVRLAEVGATYKLTHITLEYRFAVSEFDDVVIVNVETGRHLAWRQEGDKEWFLIEDDTFSFHNRLQFAEYTNSSAPPLPCLLDYPPRACSLYNILKFRTSLGLTPYVENNATYFKLSTASSCDEALFPFLLIKVTNSSAPLE